jgi:hypothetical protein
MVRRDNGKRLDRLEQLFAATTDEATALHIDPEICAVMDEYGQMKADMAENVSRGGVEIKPVNAAAELYGPDYTQKQFRELAISRALEKRGRSACEIAERMGPYLEFLDEGGRDKHIGAID